MTALRGLAIVVLLVLTGCATAPDSNTATSWPAYREHAASVTDWDLSAKVALRWRGGAESASLGWSQRAGRSEVDLSGPFGAGAVRIIHEKSTLQVMRGGERSVYDTSTPETLAAATGWPIPVDALRFWLRGLPDPDQPLEALQLDQGRASEIRQGGWVIAYAAYTGAGTGTLPAKLTLTHAADAISLRLVNGQWTVGDA